MSNSMTISPVESQLFHVDGQTDRHDIAIALFEILRTRLKKHNFLNNF
jgi:hypothetical protein